MKAYLFSLILLTSMLFVACQSNNTEQDETDKAVIDTNIMPAVAHECYTYIHNRDTARLNLMTVEGVATGELTYQLYEKDKNNGIIEGEVRGDTIIVDYTFNAEGSESIRQIVLLKKGTQLLEGIGDVEMKEGKTKFKNIKSLSFGKSIVFNKTDCK